MPKQLPVSTKKHVRLGGSNCEIWFNCTGAPKLWAQSPPTRVTDYMAEGTLAHAILENYLKVAYTGQNQRLGHYAIGTVHHVDGFEITVTEEMLEAVETAVEYVLKRVDEHGGPKVVDLFIEYSGEIKGATEELYGTCDVGIHVPYERLIVIDYKHGAGVPVDVKDNLQLLYYLLILFGAIPPDERAEIRTVEMVIIQPRCFSGGISSISMPVEALKDHYTQLVDKVKSISNGSDVLSPGSHCRWCPAKTTCPAFLDFNNKTTGIVFQDVKDIDALPVLHGLTLEQKCAIVDRRKDFDSWFDDLYADVMDATEKGRDTGYKIVESATRSRWKEGVIKELPGPYRKEVPVTITEAKKIAKAMGDDVEQWLEKPPGKRVLAKIEDRREKQTPMIDVAFADVKDMEGAIDLDGL